MLAPLARVIGPQARAWLPSAPLIAQPAPPLCEATTQWTKGLGPPGRLSLMAAPVAAPGPALARVIVKPIGEPASTLAASWTFVRVRLEQLTSSEPEARAWLPSAPLIAQPAPPLCEATTQWTKGLGPPGRLSLMAAPVAAPGPA